MLSREGLQHFEMFHVNDVNLVSVVVPLYGCMLFMHTKYGCNETAVFLHI